MAINAATAPMAKGTTQPLIPAGTYPARLAQVVDMGLQPQEFNGQIKEPKREINLSYELCGVYMIDKDGQPDPLKPRWVGEYFPLNNLKSDKARSTVRLMSIDPQLTSGGDWTKLLGAPCLVTIVHKRGKNGTMYANIGGVSQPIVGMPVPELKNEARFFDLDAPTLEGFCALPQWIQDKIKANLQYPGSKLARLLEESDGVPATNAAAVSPHEDMDDVPF